MKKLLDGYLSDSRRRRLRLLPAIVLATAVALSATAISAYDPEKSGEAPVIKPEEKPAVAPAAGLSYSWASKKIPGEFWGLAQGDVDADGEVETLLLERTGVRIARIAPDGLKQVASCPLGSLLGGARIGAIDIDGDGREEIVVSAVEEGMPASTALKFSNGKCTPLFEHSPWSLRVIVDAKGQKILAGQSWAQDSFFSGHVFAMKFENGRLKDGEKLDLPRNVRLFQFALLPAGGEEVQVAVLKGRAPLEAYGKVGRKFKRSWRSGERFGGSPNSLPASQRDVLGSEESQSVVFDTPPLAVAGLLVAVRSDMPVGTIIGRKPLVRGGRIVGFVADAALGFVERFQTQDLPHAIADIIVDSSGRLLVLVQVGGGMFTRSMEGMLLAYDISGGK